MTIEHVKFELKIESGNAAIVEQTTYEIGKLLTHAAMVLASDGVDCGGYALVDTNGNTVGNWSIEITESENDE